MSAPQPDPQLEAVVAEVRRRDSDGSTSAQVLRKTLDQLYDGQRTGRYRWDELHKTEKTHFGTLIEINLHRAFEFQDGDKLDYLIAGQDVDCKCSQTLGGWMIPPEAHGHLCLLVWVEDQSSKWSMGIVRATVDHLNVGANRDAKATLNKHGRESITWLFDHAPLSPNVLLQLDRQAVDRIMQMTSGQKRVNELFRVALGVRVGRTVVATVARQDDYMKRVRANGGARTALQPEGIVILGQFQSHNGIARSLGVPVPGPGDSVSVRLTPSARDGSGVAKIAGRLWKVAGKNDPVGPAPDLPEI